MRAKKSVFVANLLIVATFVLCLGVLLVSWCVCRGVDGA